jgi:hypothetical protein
MLWRASLSLLLLCGCGLSDAFIPSKLSMSISSGCGSSNAPSTKDAVRSAVQQARAGLSSSQPAIAFVSCTVDRDCDEVLREFKETLPGVPLHGITSSGAILSTEGALKNAIGCLLIDASTKGSFTAASNMEGDALKASEELKALLGGQAPQAIIMGTTPGQEEGAIAQIESVFGPDIPIFGGTAADNELNGSWKVLTNKGVSGQGVSIVSVGSGVKMGASISGCYTETSKKGVATKASGRTVAEIDGNPAADWVYAWLGEEVKEQYENGGLILPQTAQRPISLRQPSGEYVNCHLAAFDGTSVNFFTPIPEGAELLVMDSADGPATGYAAHLANSYDMAATGLNEPKAGILIYCGGMAIAVGDKLNDGLRSPTFGSKLSGLPVLGMTVFGEQTRLARERKNVQCNLSLGMILFE